MKKFDYSRFKQLRDKNGITQEERGELLVLLGQLDYHFCFNCKEFHEEDKNDGEVFVMREAVKALNHGFNSFDKYSGGVKVVHDKVSQIIHTPFEMLGFSKLIELLGLPKIDEPKEYPHVPVTVEVSHLEKNTPIIALTFGLKTLEDQKQMIHHLFLGLPLRFAVMAVMRFTVFNTLVVIQAAREKLGIDPELSVTEEEFTMFSKLTQKYVMSLADFYMKVLGLMENNEDDDETQSSSNFEIPVNKKIIH